MTHKTEKDIHLKTQIMCRKSHHQKILLRTGMLALSASLLLGCNPSSNSDTALDSQKQLTIKRDNFGVPHIYANDIAKFLIIYHNRSYGILNRF